MVAYPSNFMGNFKLGDNIVFNLSILACLYNYREQCDRKQKPLLLKPMILTNVSIIDALLYDLYYRVQNHTREFTQLPYNIIDTIRGKQIDKLDKYIEHARKHDLFIRKGTSFYDDLHELRKIRNRIHIQNEKKDFEDDDYAAFNERRLLLSEVTLETVISVLLEKYGRPHNHVEDFVLPWESRLK